MITRIFLALRPLENKFLLLLIAGGLTTSWMVTRRVDAKDHSANPTSRPTEPTQKPLSGVFIRIEDNALVFGQGERAATEARVALDDTTKIFLQDQPAKPDDLKPGMLLTLTQVEGITTEIHARPSREMARAPRGDVPRGDVPRGDVPRGDAPRGDAPREGAGQREGDRPAIAGDKPRGDAPRAPDVEHREPSHQRGILAHLDGTNLVITRAEHEEWVQLSIPTDDKTRVSLDRQEAKLTDLRPGMFVSVRLTQGSAINIEAKRPRPITLDPPNAPREADATRQPPENKPQTERPR